MISKVKTKKNYRVLRIVMALALTFCLMAAISLQVSAEASNSVDNSAVNEVGNSLLQVRMVYTDSDGVKTPIQGGTGFLINENTVLTCAHVVDVSSDTTDVLKELYDSDYNKNNLSLEVVVKGDVTIPTTIQKESQESDFAILVLNDAIYTKTPAALGDGNAVASPNDVYSLSFPESVAELQDANTYTKEDVTIEKGNISKLNTSNGVDYIQHSAKLTAGSSGGPLVDSDGNVIGINKGAADNYYYSINIEQIKDVLDLLGIQYTDGSGNSVAVDESESAVVSEPESEIESVIDSDVEENIDSVSSALIDSDEEIATPGSENNTTKIIIIAAIAVLVVILIIVIILIATSGKKNNSNKITPQNQTVQIPQQQSNLQGQVPGANPMGSVNPMNPPRPANPNVPGQQRFTPPAQQYNRVPAAMSMGSSPTVISNEGAGETSVLNDGAGETTVLGNQATSFVLVRKSNSEKINITKPEFVIGKERRRVDYCISDNNSVSRTHAKLKVRADRCYIADLGSTNFTFVNGTKLSPNQEVVLSKGDEIRISDEVFEFLG